MKLKLTATSLPSVARMAASLIRWSRGAHRQALGRRHPSRAQLGLWSAGEGIGEREVCNMAW